jgi:high-affinity Fe2+/Pb2+ permease
MDEDERWRRASEWADRFTPFRRRQPIYVGLVFALVASIALAIFLSLAGLKIGQIWIEALVSIVAVMLIGGGLALLSNREAKSTFIAEYHRLNKVKPAPNRNERAKRSVLP